MQKITGTIKINATTASNQIVYKKLDITFYSSFQHTYSIYARELSRTTLQALHFALSTAYKAIFKYTMHYKY